MNRDDYLRIFETYKGTALYEAFELKDSVGLYISVIPPKFEEEPHHEKLRRALYDSMPNLKGRSYMSLGIHLNVIATGLMVSNVEGYELNQLVCTHQEAQAASDLLTLVRERINAMLELESLRTNEELVRAADLIISALHKVGVKSLLTGMEHSLKQPVRGEPSYQSLMDAWAEFDQYED